jgi:hypothetical protein
LFIVPEDSGGRGTAGMQTSELFEFFEDSGGGSLVQRSWQLMNEKQGRTRVRRLHKLGMETYYSVKRDLLVCTSWEWTWFLRLCSLPCVLLLLFLCLLVHSCASAGHASSLTLRLSAHARLTLSREHVLCNGPRAAVAAGPGHDVSAVWSNVMRAV